VGAGGAARGALAALCRAGVASVAVLNRTASAAREMIALFQRDYPLVALSVIDPQTGGPGILEQTGAGDKRHVAGDAW